MTGTDRPSISRLKIPRDQGVESSLPAFGVAAGEIHAAIGSEPGMRTERSAGDS